MWFSGLYKDDGTQGGVVFSESLEPPYWEGVTSLGLSLLLREPSSWGLVHETVGLR